MTGSEDISVRQARRLALARAGLLKPAWTGGVARAAGRGARARKAALAVIDRSGYLQLDTVSIAGARSHTLVLLSRLEGMDPALGEELLRPGAPLFEYWGHEASWIPLDLYPAFSFRRRDFRVHPWWGDVVTQHREVTRRLRRQIREQGPLRSLDMEGKGSSGWWDLKVARRVAATLWSSGELAIRERRNFQRTFDLTERVIPEPLRSSHWTRTQCFDTLLLRALEGHGWATMGTLASTWRLRNCREELRRSLRRLQAQRRVEPCELHVSRRRRIAGWIRPEDRGLAARLDSLRPRKDRGVLLSPFDPVLWDRTRVQQLFGFDQVLEIFKPAPRRTYGYYCLPVLAGEQLIARMDLKARRSAGQIEVLSCRFESTGTARSNSAAERAAAAVALQRHAEALQLATSPGGLHDG